MGREDSPGVEDNVQSKQRLSLAGGSTHYCFQLVKVPNLKKKLKVSCMILTK